MSMHIEGQTHPYYIPDRMGGFWSPYGADCGAAPTPAFDVNMQDGFCGGNGMNGHTEVFGCERRKRKAQDMCSHTAGVGTGEYEKRRCVEVGQQQQQQQQQHHLHHHPTPHRAIPLTYNNCTDIVVHPEYQRGTTEEEQAARDQERQAHLNRARSLQQQQMQRWEESDLLAGID